MLPTALPPLANVTIRVSDVVPAPIAEVWKQVRAFGPASEWMAPVGLERVTSVLLPGSVEGQLGALRRMCFGDLGFVEQLDALDDEDYSMKWRVISHPLNTNPFPGSFLNYKGRMRLIGVTMQTLTLLEFEGAFDTEHMSAEVMRRELTARYEANLRGLVTLLQARTSVAAHKAAVATMLGSMSLQTAPLGLGQQVVPPSLQPVVPPPLQQVVAPALQQVVPPSLASLPTQSGVVLPTGAVALVPTMANQVALPAMLSNSMGGAVPVLSNSMGGAVPVLSNSMGGAVPVLSNSNSMGGAVPNLAHAAAAQNLAVQQNLAAQQTLAAQRIIAASQGMGGSSGVYYQVLNPGQAPQLVAAPQMGRLPLQQPLLQQVQHSGGGAVMHSGGMQQLLPGIPSGGSSGLSLSQGGLQQVLSGEGAAYGLPPMHSHGGGLPGYDPGLGNSFNSDISNHSLGSIRGTAMSRALAQASAGMLPPQQAAALAALQQRKAQQAAWQAREREALIINSAAGNDVANPGAQGRPDQRSMHNSGDSQGSGVGFAAASPPCLSPRSLERAKKLMSASEAPALLERTGRITSL